jgi:hypothetical protein
LNRENVAIIAKFSLKKDPAIQFVVATTHLLYNPRRQDVRLAQVQVMLAELDRHAQTIDKNGDKLYLPVILTGDFNLQPYSAPYNLIISGKINNIIIIIISFFFLIRALYIAPKHDLFIKLYFLVFEGTLNYENLSPKTLQTQKESSCQPNGRRLLPIKLGISDECTHYSGEIKVSRI